MFSSGLTSGIATLSVGAFLVYILYRTDNLQPLPATRLRKTRPIKYSVEEERPTSIDEKSSTPRSGVKQDVLVDALDVSTTHTQPETLQRRQEKERTAWTKFTSSLSAFSEASSTKFSAVAGQISGYIVPEWVIQLPENISKLQRELSMAPGSLADGIWIDAQDPELNPEILKSASVRVSADLCNEEQRFRDKRKKAVMIALASYLDIPVQDIHPDDVPTIAMVGSGGGLRALVAGTGSFLAAKESGLFDCVTYTAGVSGSCWAQVLFNSSLGQQDFNRVVNHLRARIGIHIAYPPVALAALNSAPTNKFLLSGFVEKLKGDAGAEFGLVDVYGLLLAARLLVPKGEIGVNDLDLKLSNQQAYIQIGEQPMPIYTAVRHEIPISKESSEEEKASGKPSEETKEKAKREAFFQWFEISPYEMFCEEFNAGIPTWAIGRKFENGKDVAQDDGLHVPELRVPLLLGTFGSAFCATLSHYYKEVKPLVKGLVGFRHIDEIIEDRNEDLSKVHPIDPASIPNFAYKMGDQLPSSTPVSLYEDQHIQLMDAGMSNNLPIYPLLRPGRDVDILVAFDSSADVKTDDWLAVADGYARQRGIKGWPVGLGWPKSSDPAEKTASQLDAAEAKTAEDAERKLGEAQSSQASHLDKVIHDQEAPNSTDAADAGDLGYCTVWVGTTEERSMADSEPPKSKTVEEDWQLMEPDAGIAVVYLPLLSNPAVDGVDPLTSEYLSTWNFVYTAEQIDRVIALARANYAEGAERMKATVRAVYARKKKTREERERAEREERHRRKIRLGLVGKKGEGDHFHLT